MKKLFLVAAFGVAGLLSAKTTTISVDPSDCVTTSTTSTTTSTSNGSTVVTTTTTTTTTFQN